MDKNKKWVLTAWVIVSSFLGGAISSYLFQPRAAWAGAWGVVRGDKFELMNGGTIVGDIFSPAEGGGVLDLYARDGGPRIQIGTYDSGAEKGQPLVALSDNTRQLRFLIRLAGSNESPVLVFKDKRGRDRMVMGLGLADSTQEPFLAVFDYVGKKKLIFGTY